MMVCQQCGNAAQADDAFCASCGALLEWSGQPVPGSPAPGSPAPVPRQPAPEADRPQPVQLAEQPVYTGPYCYSCGVRNPAGRTFCRSCGEKLHGEMVQQAARRGWWRRLMDRLRGHQPSAAGDRPRGFVRHDEIPAVGAQGAGAAAAGTMAAGTGRSWASGMSQRSLRIKRPRRLVLSRFGPLLIVVGLLGFGLGPARGWITTHLFGLESKVNSHLHQHYADIVPTGATASSAAPGHGPALAIDGVQGTYWLTSTGGGGHPRLVIRFSSPQNIDQIGMLSGEPGGQYRAEARPETLKVSAPGQSPASLSFDDTQGFQHRPVSLHGVTRVSITIKNVYPGQRGQAVAIREIDFFNLV